MGIDLQYDVTFGAHEGEESVVALICLADSLGGLWCSAWTKVWMQQIYLVVKIQ